MAGTPMTRVTVPPAAGPAGPGPWSCGQHEQGGRKRGSPADTVSPEPCAPTGAERHANGNSMGQMAMTEFRERNVPDVNQILLFLSQQFFPLKKVSLYFFIIIIY